MTHVDYRNLILSHNAKLESMDYKDAEAEQGKWWEAMENLLETEIKNGKAWAAAELAELSDVMAEYAG